MKGLSDTIQVGIRKLENEKSNDELQDTMEETFIGTHRDRQIMLDNPIDGCKFYENRPRVGLLDKKNGNRGKSCFSVFSVSLYTTEIGSLI